MWNILLSPKVKVSKIPMIQTVPVLLILSSERVKASISFVILTPLRLYKDKQTNPKTIKTAIFQLVKSSPKKTSTLSK